MARGRTLAWGSLILIVGCAVFYAADWVDAFAGRGSHSVWVLVGLGGALTIIALIVILARGE